MIFFRGYDRQNGLWQGVDQIDLSLLTQLNHVSSCEWKYHRRFHNSLGVKTRMSFVTFPFSYTGRALARMVQNEVRIGSFTGF